MDAQAKKALYRAKLKAQKQEKRIDSPLVRYNEHDQPVCRVCDIVLKSESAWSAHQVSSKHHEAIKNVKANAATATQVNNIRPATSSGLPKPKAARPAESYNNRPGQPAAQSPSVIPSNFFDKPEIKKQKNEVGNVKSANPDHKKKVSDSGQTHVMNAFDGENEEDDVRRAKVVDTTRDEAQPSYADAQASKIVVSSEAQQKGALPEGFFDDKDADLRARGIKPVKIDIKDEYKEFEKLIQEDLKEVDNRLEEEEYDAAETIEEAETVEQKAYRERVEMLKRKKLELTAARSSKRSKVPQVMEKESSHEESSSDEDSDDAVDWRAKHL